MRGLIVGLGSIGRRHARNWAALRLGPLAICRQTRAPQPEALDVSANVYDDLDEALSVERPDVVLVTNPTSLHVETACRAVRAGAHAFVEKPLGHDLSGVDALLQEACSANRQIVVGYNLRFHPGLARLKDLVEQDAIGRIVSARAEVGEYLPDWHPWEDYRQSYSGRRDLGGGAVLTFSHELDALCWVLGAPRRLTAITAHASSLEIDTEDVAEIVLEFESGALGSIHIDYVRRPPSRSIELVGERGTLRWEYAQNRVLQYVPRIQQWRIEEGDPRWERNDMYVAELRELQALVRGEGRAERIASGDQGAAVLALSLAALRAAADGGTVELRREPLITQTWLNSFRQHR